MDRLRSKTDQHEAGAHEFTPTRPPAIASLSLGFITSWARTGSRRASARARPSL